MSDAPSPNASRPALGLSPELRPWVSLAIFLHLFFVFLALTSNAGSAIQNQLLSAFAFYVYPLNLPVDHTTNYQLTHATTLDVDHAIEVEVPTAGGQSQVYRVPDAGWRGGEAFRRKQKLADVAAEWATIEDDEERKQRLPQALAGHFMNKQQANTAQVRVKSHLLVAPLAASSSDKAQSDPNSAGYFRTLYDAKATSFGGQIGLLEKAAALETAPAQPGAPANTDAGKGQP
jgi:hypothetical protein